MIGIYMWLILGMVALASTTVVIRRRRASAISEDELDRLLDELDRVEAPDPTEARTAQQASLARILADHPANDAKRSAGIQPSPAHTRGPSKTRHRDKVRTAPSGAAIGIAVAACAIAVLSGIVYSVVEFSASSTVNVGASATAVMLLARVVWALRSISLTEKLPELMRQVLAPRHRRNFSKRRRGRRH